MRRLATAAGVASLAVLGAALLAGEAGSRSPEQTFWRLGAPVLAAVLASGFIALRREGRLALAALVGSVALVEAGFAVADAVTRPDVETWIDPAYYRDHPTLGYGPVPGFTTRAWKRVDAETVYDVEYSIDAAGRRLTPVGPPTERSRFLLFFGGSFLFGEGVGDRETLPFRVGELAPEYTPYNYGFHGYGPPHLLARLEASSLRDEVKEPDGHLVYLFIDSHVNRAIGSFVIYTGWSHATPNYVVTPDGEVVRRGTLTTGRPLTSFLYSLLGMSPTVRYLRLELPRRIDDAHIRFTARLFARAAQLFHDRFGDGNFVVVIFPGSQHAKRLVAALEREGVASLDYSGLIDRERPEYFIPQDWHPSPLTHRLLAEQLVRDLALDGAVMRGLPER